MVKALVGLVIFGFIHIIVNPLYLQLRAEDVTQPAPASQQQPLKTVAHKTVEGVVTGLSGNFMAVQYGRDETQQVCLEMAFNVDPNVKIEHKQSIKDFVMGDTVFVSYDLISEKFDDDTELKKIVATKISFVRPAQKRPDEAALVSTEEEPESLPIKGPKGE